MSSRISCWQCDIRANFYGRGDGGALKVFVDVDVDDVSVTLCVS